MILHETLPIGKGGWVLEVGSGHNPHPRSDVLVDNALESDVEREGGLVKTRPLLIAYGEALPFADKTFDYVVCSHVLEHALDPKALLQEIMRVGKAGYIETPNSVGEKLFNWPYHRWLLDVEDGVIVMRPKKSEDVVFGHFFHDLTWAYWEVRWFLRRNKDLFHVRYFWEDKIPYRIEAVPNATVRQDFNAEMAAKNAEVGQTRVPVLQAKTERSFANRAVRAVKSLLFSAEELPVRLINASRRRASEDFVLSHLACPACKGKGRLSLNGETAVCQTCSRTYSKKSTHWDFRIDPAA